MECVFNCFVIHLITLNVPHYLIQCSTWTSPTLWLLCFSCSLIFGVLFKIGPCCLISNPLTSSQTYGLDEKRSCLRCHCYISDPCVCRLAEASARQPSHRLAPPSQRDCSFFFFFTAYWRGTQACGVRQKSYLFLCHFIRPRRHIVRVLTHKHTYPKKLFYFASVVGSEKCCKSLLRVVLFSQKLPNNITVPALFALLPTDYIHFHYTSIMQ